MHLRLIEIENFRGIKSLSLKLDVITAIFGEGSFGKTSLLEALYRCLGGSQSSISIIDTGGDTNISTGAIPEFSHEDFHVPSGEMSAAAKRLSIELTFREGRPGEWDAPSYDKIRKTIAQWRDGRSAITLQLVAERKSPDSPVQTRCSFLDPDGKPLSMSDPAKQLAELKALVPILILPTFNVATIGSITQTQASDGKDAAKNETAGNGLTVEDAEMYILSVYRKALSRPEQLTRTELVNAIRALPVIGRRYPRFVGGQISRFEDWIDEIIRKRGSGLSIAEVLSSTPLSDMQQILALLAVLGSLLESLGFSKLSENAEPIIAVENLEINLHPILLASIWDLLAQIPAQKIVVTNSDDLLGSMPLTALRRMVRHRDGLSVFNVRWDTLSQDDARRVGYHVRQNRADSIMARCWLLVEGESEFWLFPEMAHLLGYDFKTEGVRIIEFAQCGLEPMIRMARDLGIQWHVFVDGDDSGRAYARIAKGFVNSREEQLHITCLRELDIEHHLAKNGFLDVYRRAADRNIRSNKSPRKGDPRKSDASGAIIRSAVKRSSKPALILSVLEVASRRGSEAVTPDIAKAIRCVIDLARSIEPKMTVPPNGKSRQSTYSPDRA
jgi:Predicted ATP-dependent endonuclease of the OLD family